MSKIKGDKDISAFVLLLSHCLALEPLLPARRIEIVPKHAGAALAAGKKGEKGDRIPKGGITT